MLKIQTQFSPNHDFPQHESAYPYHRGREVLLEGNFNQERDGFQLQEYELESSAYSLTRAEDSSIVSITKRNPSLAARAIETAMINGDNASPIIAVSDLTATGMNSFAGTYIAEAAMTYDTGYIRIPRSLLNDPRFKDAPISFRIVFFTLLEIVAFRETEHNDHGTILKIKPGQVCISIRKLAELCGQGITKKMVEKALAYFKKYNFGGQERGHRRNIISITHKDTYDLILKQEGTSRGTKRGQAGDIKEECKEREEHKKEKKKSAARAAPVATEDGLRRATLLFDGIKRRNENFAAKDLGKWAVDIDKLQRIDGVSWERIDSVLEWLPSSDFWWKNILSGDKLRAQFEKLEMEIQAKSLENIVNKHRNMCLEVKRLYPNQLRHMRINRDSVVNEQNSKDVSFNIDHQRFVSLMKHIFGLEIE